MADSTDAAFEKELAAAMAASMASFAEHAESEYERNSVALAIAESEYYAKCDPKAQAPGTSDSEHDARCLMFCKRIAGLQARALGVSEGEVPVIPDLDRAIKEAGDTIRENWYAARSELDFLHSSAVVAQLPIADRIKRDDDVKIAIARINGVLAEFDAICACLNPRH